MTRKNKILVLLCCLFPWMWAAAQTVNTTAGSGAICPGEEIVVPVTVSNCNGVAAISLVLGFDNTKVSYDGYQNVNSAVSSMLINQSNGTIYMTWANMSAVNVGNGILVELRFTSNGISGNANLSWNTSQCEYSGVSGTPLSANYTNGTVNVYAVPSISSHPTGLTLTEGNSSYFQVSASGQEPSYQWQILTPGESTWLDLGNDSHHSGATNYRLYVNNVTMAMNGNKYRCVVSGTCGSPVTSRMATLTVQQYIPTIATSLGTVNTCFDQVFSIPVNVTNCNNVGAISLVLNYDASRVTYVGYESVNPELNNGYMRVNASNGAVYFTWATSSQALQIGNGQLLSLAFRSAAGNSQLTWNTARCEYSNPTGQSIPASYSGSNLTIYYPPTITSQPSNRSVMEGGNTSFSINASGNNLAYQWKMSQDNGISWETLSNGGHYSGVNGSTLYINNVLYTMNGYRYRCEVNGTCEPSVISNHATLSVEMLMSNIQTTAGSLNTCTQTSFGIPISVAGCNRVGAISLVLAYDNTKLTYSGYEGVNPALANGMLQVNALNGMVFISWASVEGANVGDANLLTLNFTAQTTGTSSLTWNTNYCEYANPQGAVFPATFVNGIVTVGDMSFQIASQPSDQTVTMGENTSFNVEVSGTTSGFQWQVSTDGGSSWTNVVVGNGEHYSNPNSYQLSVSNTTIEMNGYRYRCVISGDCGVQYTSAALLTVNLPPNYYEITLAADPEEGGTVTGAGAHMENTPCTVVATPNTGYNFVNWTENGEEVSTEASYTFIPTDSRDLVAHFALQEITINVSANPIGAGTLNGGGTYLYGSHVLLTAIPITGSVFDNWTENDEIISTNQSISFTAEADRTLVANFSVQIVNITATAVPAGNGTIEGAGEYAYGSTVTLVAHAGEGFEFSNWTENGLVISTNDTLSFVAEDDRNLEAQFVTQSLTITTAVDPEIGGTVTGAGTYEYGDPVVLTATPIGTAEFIEWRENGLQVSDQPTYSFNAYTDRHLVAHFNVTANIIATVDPEGSGVITGSGTYTYGHTATLSVSPNTGYSFVNWTESDTVYSTNTTISLTAYESRSFVAHFDSIMHHVSVSSNSEVAGWVSGGGDFIEGSQVIVSAHPNNQFDFVRWTENNQTISVNPNYSFQIWDERNLLAEFERHITDTTAYTCHDFEWHGHTYTSNGIYYDTLTSYLGIDSIVRLHLQFLPNYYIPEERFVCDSLSVMWHGQTLTDSGVYYDSLFSVNGCDSIHAMTIQFFRTPVGDFSYMTPSNDAEITVMPLTLAWNTVPGATSYDLYLWDVNDPEPDVPYRPNMSSSYTTVSALMNYHTYNWYVVARNACHEQTSEMKSFHLNVTPDLSVNQSSLEFVEVTLNHAESKYLTVSGYYLGSEVVISVDGEDADAYSYTTASGWNGYTGGNLVVTFNPTTPKSAYNATLTVSSELLSQTVSLTGTVANLYSFTTVVDENVFSMGSTIPIHGNVLDWNGQPVANFDVEVGVTVMNMKRTIETQTDANGQFEVEFTPLATESGYYTVNSGRLNNNSTAVHDVFNIPGIATVGNDFKYCLIDQGWSKTDSILIRNKSNLPLTHIQVTPMTHPDGCSFSAMPFSLGGLEEDYLVYTISGSELSEGNQYLELRLKVASAEGAETQFTVWYYCKEARGDLDVWPRTLATTMTKGESKIVDVMLVNGGTYATGAINIELPNSDWLSVVGGNTLSSIAVNDTAYFSLRLSPSENIDLVQYTGSLVIHSERGDDEVMYYNIQAVSESVGSILVDATDDFTYNTNGGFGPHLEGAYVTITNYYSLERVAQGYTDADGHFYAPNLPEGYYRVKVTADQHDEYINNINVTPNPTRATRVNAYMQYQAVTYSWDVQPTEIEDTYTFELVAVFETQVPVPVITIDFTATRDDLEPGETDNFNLIITNHGLITAYESAITFDQIDGYDFVPLYDVIDSIPAQTTILVPCQYTRLEQERRTRGGSGCYVRAHTMNYYYCNSEKQWQKFKSKEIAGHECDLAFAGFNDGYLPSSIYLTGYSPSTPSISLPGGGITMVPNQLEHTPKTTSEECTPCLDALKNAAKAIGGAIKGGAKTRSRDDMDEAAEALDYYNSMVINSILSMDIDNDPVDNMIGFLNDYNLDVQEDRGVKEKIMDKLCGFPGAIFDGLAGINDAANNCYRTENDFHKSTEYIYSSPTSMNMTADRFLRDVAFLLSLEISGEASGHFLQLFSEDSWREEEHGMEFLNAFLTYVEMSDDKTISEENAAALAAEFVGTAASSDDVLAVVERWNRSVGYWNDGIYMKDQVPDGYSDEFMEYDEELYFERTQQNIDDYQELKSLYGNRDGNSLLDDMGEAMDNTFKEVDDESGSNSVCAHVTVEFSQTMSMTREAFEGTFSVHNGNEVNSIKNIDLDFVVIDTGTGEDCTHLFQINTTQLNYITNDINGNGELGPSRDGSAIIMFIPTRNAAPTEPKVYSFGGTFGFLDPYTEEPVVFDLYPVDITVNPSPDLYVDYFMQRDILGDDALTEDRLEPSLPAELGVRIHNQGAGVAKNVNLETAEPEIVDNEKGLAVDFAMYGASFNGSPAQLGMMNISFGNIAPGATGVGEWLFTSSLLGHFVSYEAHVIHNNSYGNPELSLVSSLRIHELIHPIRVYGADDDGINDFLVNDDDDTYEMPDTIYFSQGGRTSVGEFASLSFNHEVTELDTIVTLTANPSGIGWNYGKCDDPGSDKYELVSCTRDFDNQEIPLQNVWQTFVTLHDQADPLYENKLHLVDTLANDGEEVTYTLVYTLKPDLLRVKEIIGIPTEGFIEYPLTNFQVKFNEPICDSTFTYEDMTLKCQNGPNRMDSTVVITRLTDSLYNVNIAGLTNDTGYYVLNVNTIGIKDRRGYNGYLGKQASWVEVLTSIAQAMSLQQGWNWWSTNIEQNGIDGLTMLENNIGQHGLTIKSQNAFIDNFYQSMGYNYWFGTLESLENEKSYLINMDEDIATEMVGTRAVPQNHPITIEPNWNWIGYPVAFQQSVVDAFGNFTPAANDVVKGQADFSSYYEGYGWFPNDFMMTPGKGYLYQSNAAENNTLVYPNNARNIATSPQGQTHFWNTNVYAYPDNFNIIAVVTVDSIEQRNGQTELGAFVNGKCRGSARLRHFEPSDRYYAMLTVTGDAEEDIVFALVDTESGETWADCDNQLAFKRDVVLGSIDDPYVVQFSTNKASSVVKPVTLYPNPVDRNQVFALNIPQDEAIAELIVTDVLGETVRHETGALDIRSVKGLPVAGVYVIKATAKSGNVYYGRIIVK